MTAVTLRSPSELWLGFLNAAKPRMSSHVFETWLRPIHCVRYADDTVVLEVRDQFSRDWLNDHYLDFIREGLNEILGTSTAIEWVVNPALATLAAPATEPEPEAE